MQPESTKQHEWLQQLVGTWTFTSHCDGGPEDGPVAMPGTERVRAMGDLWIVAEGAGEMPGGEMMSYVMTLGYDPQRERFVGSWAGSPMTHLFVYEGVLEPDGLVLPLDTTGPAFDDPTKTAHYQDVIDLRDGGRTLRSRLQGEDGEWQEFMRAPYERVP